MPRKKSHLSLSTEGFLRSVNLRYDADAPDRIAHFHPTTKCATLLRSLLGHEADRAFFVVAPYGSGKSLTATYLLHLIENRPSSDSALRSIGSKLSHVSPDLGRFAANRRSHPDRRGIVLALHGACTSVASSIKDAALESMTRLKLGREARSLQSMPAETIDHAIDILAEVAAKCRAVGGDRIVILWDEFGRHVESLVADGRGRALSEIQTLAEFVVRCRDIPVTIGLLLHQGLLHYASNLPQSVRAEWTKIEGRFRSIQYLDDSKEIYRLIAEVANTASRSKPKARDSYKVAAQRCAQHGLFRDFKLQELSSLLQQAAPLDPITLYLLPRIASRVAQNERTLFSFLHDIDLSLPVTPADLYDYFCGAMRADTAVGGTHRQWLETESALSKVADDNLAIQALKTACLLGLGISGERSRTSYELLVTALGGAHGQEAAKATLARLIDRKLLLHRRHNDEVTVWHGTDLDLRGRLEDAKRRQAESFDLVGFLSKEALPPSWKPVDYNDEFYIRRYLAGEYQSVRRFDAFVNFDLVLKDFPVDCDGKIIYLIAETADELREAEALSRERLNHDRLVVAIPREPLPLHDTAMEVSCLTNMQLDRELIESDPLALKELQQMTDDARDHLQRLLDRLIGPNPSGPRWFCQGNELAAESPRELRRALSDIMRTVYGRTPRINNEMIVRKKPSSIVINARKKLLLGILERSGQESLGIKGNFPDMSMFRTVLQHTGIYRQDRHGRWWYAAPNKLSDRGLEGVWQKIREFLTVPSERPKEPSLLFDELLAPPFGVRAGLIPILFAAGLKAFPSAISLTRNGEYVNDILPSEIEQLCREPHSYRLMVLDLDEAKLAYLRDLHKRFSAVTGYELAENDLIRMCFDAIEGWKAQLPPAAISTRQLSEVATRFRTAITRRTDPVALLLEHIPSACGFPLTKRKKLLASLETCMQELSSVSTIYAEHAAAAIRKAVSLGDDASSDSIREVAFRWASCFSSTFIEGLADGVGKALLSRMRTAYDSDHLLLESLASLLVGKSLTRWDDATVAAFDREMYSVVHRVEDAGLAVEGRCELGANESTGMRALLRGRIQDLVGRLARLVGEDDARETLKSLTLQKEPVS